MEAGFVVSIAAVLLAATLFFALGVYIGSRTKKTDTSMGILNVDCSDPANGAYLYLNLSASIAEVADQKRVMFDVHVIN